MSDKREFDWKAFFHFEKENELFARKNKEGIYIWDIIRYEVYVGLLRGKAITDPPIKRTASAYLSLLSDLLSLSGHLFRGKYKYIFFTASRNRTKEGLFYDQHAEDTLALLRNDALILENFERDRHRSAYKRYLYNRIVIFRRFIAWFLRNEDYSDLLALISRRFDSHNLSGKRLNQLVKYFRIEYAYYKWLFKRKQARAVFITQNGIQKGLFAAARDLHIPVIEFQHGLIEPEHIAYNYSKDIDYLPSQLYLPLYFFTFSEYWTRSLNYPVRQVIPAGNTALYNSRYVTAGSQQGAGLVVVSADVYGQDLKALVMDFLQYNKTTPVYFKLHPNQFHEEDLYKTAFKGHDNVKVISREQNMHELISMASAVVVIKSTAVYEALHMRRIGIIYTGASERTEGLITTMPNVYEVANGKELKAAFEKNFIDTPLGGDIFFGDFDSDVVNAFLKQIKD